MAATDFTAPASAGGQFARLAVAGFDRLAAFLRAYRNRRAIARLAGFDERLLRDIGVTSGDVHAAMAAPLGEDPTRQLADLARERRSALRARAQEQRAWRGHSMP